MVFRVYVEKKQGLDHEASSLCKEINTFLGIEALERVRVINRYDVENATEQLFSYAVQTVLSEPQLDNVSEEIDAEGATVFAVEFLPGQYDQRADSAAQCMQIISMGDRPAVRTAKVYLLYGALTEANVAAIKKHVINPVESRDATLDKPETLAAQYDIPTEVETLHGFCEMDADALKAFVKSYGLAMDMDDLAFCRDYFVSEKRDPTITEIRMIDTYWSDHCRHTTFLTEIGEVEIEDKELARACSIYKNMSAELGREHKPMTLMDIATIGTRYLKANGKLPKIDESEEINACTVKITVKTEEGDEPWLLLFKNETHNHPTEIEPFGGAATCIGGAIRDPLSGRSYVYAAMRVTGGADPTRALS